MGSPAAAAAVSDSDSYVSNSSSSSSSSKETFDDWNVGLKVLQKFYESNGIGSVPSPQNAKLADWIDGQRRDYLNFYEGRRTSLSSSQVVQLEKLGFSKYLPKD